MKLLHRTLLFFISVILFQAVLSVLLVQNVVNRSNREDARNELEIEARKSYEELNAWKRGVWKSLIRLANDAALSGAESGRPSDRRSVPAAARVRELLATSGYDLALLRDRQIGGASTVVPFSEQPPELPAEVFVPENFRHVREHPYLRMRLDGEQVLLIGSLLLSRAGPESPAAPSPAASSIECYIVKFLNDRFLAQQAAASRARVSLMAGERTIAGEFRLERAAEMVRLLEEDLAYRELYDIGVDRQLYNATLQKIGPLEDDPQERELYLVTSLSDEPYAQRLLLIERTVLSGTLVSAVLALVLGLFFTGNITRPVRSLSAAMQSIRAGRYDAEVPLAASREMRELLEGFNIMAWTLRQDKATMHRYIHEITLLKDYNETIIDSIRAGIAIIGYDLKLEKTNRSFVELFRLCPEGLAERDIASLGLELFDDVVLGGVREILRGERELLSTVRRIAPRKVFEVKLSPLRDEEPGERGIAGCVMIVDDISGKIELEEKIFQAEKLSSISMLSAGVAHEVNNPLSSIMTNVQNLLTEESDPEKQVSLRWIEQETHRIARIVRDLLDFSRRDQNGSAGCDVNAAAADIIRLLDYSRVRREDIRIRTSFAADLPPAAIGKDELKQVLMNLLTNSLQAVEGKGLIEVRTRPGGEGRIEIRVRDDGPGIRPEILPSIFDPFFTTKKNGEGTGLGLSVVYGILHQHGGSIRVRSREGERTSFTLEIPVWKEGDA